MRFQWRPSWAAMHRPAATSSSLHHPFLPHMAAQAVRVTKERKASLGWGQRASRASMHAVRSCVGRRACRQRRRQRRQGVSVWRRFQCSIGLDAALIYTKCQPPKRRGGNQTSRAAPPGGVRLTSWITMRLIDVCKLQITCKATAGRCVARIASPHSAFPPRSPQPRSVRFTDKLVKSAIACDSAAGLAGLRLAATSRCLARRRI